jgi:hypothetical protein
MKDFHRHRNLVHTTIEWIDIEGPNHQVVSNIRVKQSAPHLRHGDANAGAVLQEVFSGVVAVMKVRQRNVGAPASSVRPRLGNVTYPSRHEANETQDQRFQKLSEFAPSPG